MFFLVNNQPFCLHIDLDVLDPCMVPAVDSPDEGSFEGGHLAELVNFLAPGAIGADVTIFNPDLDPNGKYTIYIIKIISGGLRYLSVMHV